MQAIEHKEKEKLGQIKHENELLLKKLVTISKGKQMSVTNHKVNSQNKPKTLHMERMKEEAEKIDHENIKILQKITSVGPTIPKKKLDNDYYKHQGYAYNIQRAKKKELNDLFARRKEFLAKNFQAFVGPRNNNALIEKSGSQTQRLRQDTEEGGGTDQEFDEFRQDKDQMRIQSQRMNSSSNGGRGFEDQQYGYKITQQQKEVDIANYNKEEVVGRYYKLEQNINKLHLIKSEEKKLNNNKKNSKSFIEVPKFVNGPAVASSQEKKNNLFKLNSNWQEIKSHRQNYNIPSKVIQSANMNMVGQNRMNGAGAVILPKNVNGKKELHLGRIGKSISTQQQKDSLLNQSIQSQKVKDSQNEGNQLESQTDQQKQNLLSQKNGTKKHSLDFKSNNQSYQHNEIDEEENDEEVVYQKQQLNQDLEESQKLKKGVKTTQKVISQIIEEEEQERTLSYAHNTIEDQKVHIVDSQQQKQKSYESSNSKQKQNAEEQQEQINLNSNKQSQSKKSYDSKTLSNNNQSNNTVKKESQSVVHNNNEQQLHQSVNSHSHHLSNSVQTLKDNNSEQNDFSKSFILKQGQQEQQQQHFPNLHKDHTNQSQNSQSDQNNKSLNINKINENEREDEDDENAYQEDNYEEDNDFEDEEQNLVKA